MKKQFTVTDGKRTAKVDIFWLEESKYSAAHYSALISVPFQDSKIYNLFVYDEEKIDEAIRNATEYAELALSRCFTF